MILTIDHIKSVLAAYFAQKPVKKVWLFGSYARGEADEKSDVDVLVDIDYIPGIAGDYLLWPEELTEKLSKKVDIVSSGGENRYIKPFVDRDKIIVYER